MTTLDPQGQFRIRSRGFALVALFQLGLLAVLAANSHAQFNVDPICYMRIAHYYHVGNWDLAVSSYWSPMASWLLAPLLSIVDDPLTAGAIVTAFMAVVFLWGSAALMRSVGLRHADGVAGALICAVASAPWTTGGLGADVLLAGLASAAMAAMTSPRWTTTLRTPLLAGALWGIAYLTKSIALPWGIVLGGAFALVHRICGVAWWAALRSYLITVAVTVAIATPWIMTISSNSGTFTVGTSSFGAHALSAPGLFMKEGAANRTIDVLRVPEAGRLSVWEDPAVESFIRWNPLASMANFKHQLYVIVRNFMTVVDKISELDGFHLGLAATIFVFLIHGPWHGSLAAERWRWALIPVATLTAPYLPVFAAQHRYFYPIFPWLVIASLGLVATLAAPATVSGRLIPRLGRLLIVASFVFPSAWRLGALVPGRIENISAPMDLALRLKQFGYDGPTATADENPVEGLFMAYFLEQPLYEYDVESDDVGRLAAAGGKSFIVARESLLFERLLCDPCFESLDATLYQDAAEAARNPIAAFAIRRECLDRDQESSPRE